MSRSRRPDHTPEKRELPERLGGTLPQLHDPGEGGCRPPPRLGHVDMRVGAERDQEVRGRDHARCDVGVRIETGDDRHRWPDGAADALQELAFGIVLVLRHHGAVEVEIDAVEGSGARETLDDLGGDRLERLAPHRAGWARRAPQRRDQPPAACFRGGDEAGEADVDAPGVRDHRLVAAQPRPAAALLEGLDARLAGSESVGLVQEAADADAEWPAAIAAKAPCRHGAFPAASASAARGVPALAAAAPKSKPCPGAASRRARV